MVHRLHLSRFLPRLSFSRTVAQTCVLVLTGALATVLGPPGLAAGAVVPTASTAMAVAGLPRATSTTPLPGGKPRYVVSMMGGGFNAYWVRLAEYSFATGRGGVGRVHQTYWMWHQDHFVGNARANKVSTGYATAGCAATCTVRTPRGYQPGAGPMGSLRGTYRFDRFGRLVIDWPGRRTEVWTVRVAGSKLSRLSLHHTTLGGLYGDGLGSTATFTAGATRDQVASADLTGVQRVASFGEGGRYPVRISRWSTNVVAPMHRCAGAGSACLLHTGNQWRSAIVVPTGLGRRAFWEHQLQGSDGDVGICFGSGGGHTVALLQAMDDTGHFVGFVGAEASFNGRSLHNAVVAQLVLT